MAAQKSVTNPLTADLDAAFHSIVNVNRLEVSDIVHASGFQIGGTVEANDGARFLHGTIDPTVQPVNAALGSLYIRDTDGAWFRKTGPVGTDWTLVP